MNIMLDETDLSVLHGAGKVGLVQELIGVVAANGNAYNSTAVAEGVTIEAKNVTGVTRARSKSKAPEKPIETSKGEVNINTKATTSKVSDEPSGASETTSDADNEEAKETVAENKAEELAKKEKKRDRKEMLTALQGVCKTDKEMRSKVRKLVTDLGVAQLSALTDEQMKNICDEVGC